MHYVVLKSTSVPLLLCLSPLGTDSVRTAAARDTCESRKMREKRGTKKKTEKFGLVVACVSGPWTALVSCDVSPCPGFRTSGHVFNSTILLHNGNANVQWTSLGFTMQEYFFFFPSRVCAMCITFNKLSSTPRIIYIGGR